MPNTAPQFDLMGRTEPPCRSLQAVRRDVGQTSQTNTQREGDKSMKIRIHETDFEGHPVDCTGEFFFGSTAIAVVEEMKMNPFLNHLSAQEFMGQLLAAIGEKEFSLPEDPETAALAFLQKLTALGYAEFAVDKGELDTQHPVATSPVDNGEYTQNKP